jgi:hypothetical protein
MASEATVEVSVEAAIHKALTEFAQHLNEEYGIMLESAGLTWGYTGLGQKPQVIKVNIGTSTVYGAASNY